MISNQKLQNCLNEIRQITGGDAMLYSAAGRVLAQTGEEMGLKEKIISDFISSSADQEMTGDWLLLKIEIEEELQFVLAYHRPGTENVFMLGQMAACQVRNLAMGMMEQMDRSRFIQNVLLGNMLPVDIISKARRLHIEERPRVAYVIDTGDKNSDIAMELVKNLSDMRSGDFVTSVEDHSIVLIRDLSGITEAQLEKEMQAIASRLVDNLHMEAMIKVRVGYGNVVSTIKALADSYQEARMALEVGKVFYAAKDTISYGRLGIGRLICQLPPSLCEMFIQEVFQGQVPDIVEDEEAMSTISVFFENNLNISETARQLYVHRNTLVYRLERIEKAIGLDIRTFEDAMLFRIAVMVLAHLKANK